MNPVVPIAMDTWLRWPRRQRRRGCAPAAATPSDDSSAAPGVVVTPQEPPKTDEQRFHEAYAAAYTMSQLFVANRPAAVPLSGAVSASSYAHRHQSFAGLLRLRNFPHV